MRSFEKIEGGVRKFHSWGYSEIYMDNFADCFTDEELDQVVLHLTKLKNAGALTTEEEADLTVCIDERKKRRKRKNSPI